MADGTAESLRKQASGRELIKVRIEDGNGKDIQEALNRLPTVEQVAAIDVDNNRFELQCTTGHSAKRQVFKLCVDRGWVLTEIISIETRLEDIFRNLTMN